MAFTKGHPQYNTGRTRWKKGNKAWNKGTNIVLKPRTGEIRLCKYCKKEMYCQKWELDIRQYCSRRCVIDGKKVSTGYQAIHTWIKTKYGVAKECGICGSSKNVDWANKDHKYKRDISEWLQLCRRHHMEYDKNNNRRTHE
jgi:hypothetical protein